MYVYFSEIVSLWGLKKDESGHLACSASVPAMSDGNWECVPAVALVTHSRGLAFVFWLDFVGRLGGKRP